MDTSPSKYMWFVNSLSQFVVCLFILLMMSLKEKMFLILSNSNYHFFFLFWTMLLEIFLTWTLFYIRILIVLSSTYKFMLYYKLIMLCCKIQFQFFFFLYMNIQIFQHVNNIAKTTFSLMRWLCIFVENHLTIQLWIYFWTLYSIDMLVYLHANTTITWITVSL